MSPNQPEKSRSAQPAEPRPADSAVPDLASPPLTPEAEAKVKAGLENTGIGELKGFTSN